MKLLFSVLICKKNAQSSLYNGILFIKFTPVCRNLIAGSRILRALISYILMFVL